MICFSNDDKRQSLYRQTYCCHIFGECHCRWSIFKHVTPNKTFSHLSHLSVQEVPSLAQLSYQTLFDRYFPSNTKCVATLYDIAFHGQTINTYSSFCYGPHLTRVIQVQPLYRVTKPRHHLLFAPPLTCDKGFAATILIDNCPPEGHDTVNLHYYNSC